MDRSSITTGPGAPIKNHDPFQVSGSEHSVEGRQPLLHLYKDLTKANILVTNFVGLQ